MLDAIKSLFVSEAWAMAPPPGGEGGAGGGGLLASPFFMLIIIFAIFYFLLIRPQQKRMKQHKDMLAAIKKGDKVITQGGIYGLVEEVGDKTVTLKIAENTKVKFGKGYIAALRSTADEG
jgi:preprotein translocase subunit YajC